MKLTVHLGENSYPIYIENHILDHAASYIAETFSVRRIMIISDDQVVPALWQPPESTAGKALRMLPPGASHGEATKSFQNLPVLYGAMLDAGISRSDLVIALGGGVIGDLAGFAAASYLRGVRLIQIPTSLLAQVDSSVGGKVAVDLPQGKNLAGAFYQPSLVLIDPTVLDTLAPHFVSDGMGEVIKYGCIKDAGLFELLRSHRSFADLQPELPSVIARCVDIKRQVVEADQFDTGERMLLNFGHTLAHAIEQYHNYQKESHGEAVSIGMYQICRLAEEKGLTREGTAEKILEVLNIYGLAHSCGLPLADLLGAMSRDKKNLHGSLNLILLDEIGKSRIYPTSTGFFPLERTI